MDQRTTGLSRLGERVGVELDTDDTQRRDVLDAARRGFIDSFERRARAPGSWRGLPSLRLAAAGIGAVALVGFALFFWPRQELHFTTGAGAALGLGERIQSGKETPVLVRFSDGTQLTLQPTSRARVVTAGAEQARVVLESGSADLDVAPHQGREWHFEAGPFDVRVTGTRFTLGFEAARGLLSLRMKAGSVVVSNACTKESRTLRAPDELHWSCQEKGLAPTATELPGAGRPAVDSAASAVEPAVKASAPRSSAGAAPPDWRELAAQRQYATALQVAEAAGFDGLCQSLGARELLLLADTSQSAGNPARYESALKALRARFPSTDAAANAAFRLGRLAFEGRGTFAEAATWFNAYASERPAGPLVGDALGRILESHRRGGNLAAGRVAAQRYLDRFPQGPHAPLAHATLSE